MDDDNSIGYGMIWIDIEENPSGGCSWHQASFESNCAFVAEIADTLVAHGKKVGIYASAHEWGIVMGSGPACPQLGKYDLWYPHYDNSKTFSDFKPFGGW